MSVKKELKRIANQLKNYNDSNRGKLSTSYEKWGNITDRIATVIGVLAALLTLWAIWVSIKANHTSETALSHVMFKDSIDQIGQDRKDIIDSLERKMNRRYFDSSIAISKQYADAVSSQVEISANSLKLYKSFADAAKKSADMAEKSARINEQNAEFLKQSTMQQNRAYVVFDSINVKMTLDSPILLKFYLNNIGNTPAYNVGKSATILIKKNREKIDTSILNKLDLFVENFTLPHKQKTYYTWTSKIILSGDALLNFVKYDTLFVALKVRYVDIFKIAHQTRAMVYITTNDSRAHFYRRFNETD